MNPIVVVAEVREKSAGKNAVRPVTWELIAAAKKIQAMVRDGVGEEIGKDQSPPDIYILVPAQNPLAPAREIARSTGLCTIALAWPFPVTPETLKQGLSTELVALDPGFLLFAHTALGREVASGLAVRLDGIMVSGVTHIRTDLEGLVFLRPVMDNRQVLCVRTLNKHLTVLTLVPGVFGKDAPRGMEGKEPFEPGSVSVREVAQTSLSPVLVQRSKSGKARGSTDFGSAKIVVAMGRGIGEKENLDKVFEFSNRLPGAVVGASRPLVDQGWIEYSRQVGITGATVAPDLYIACGISGSTQHLAGMAGSKWVISINKNPDAPICRHSDLCIQADLNEFIDTFLESQ